MGAVRSVAQTALTMVLVLAALGLGLRLYMNRGAQDRLLPGEAVDIAALRSPLPQPSYLACPPGYCRAGEAVASPVFDEPWPQLRDAWRALIAALPRVVEVMHDPQHRRFAYVVHTAVFSFPDIVTVEFVAQAQNRSSIALFSRSRYGKSDFGKNRERATAWLLALQRRARLPPRNPGM
jgi:uncharacterized protein (DUF1499 family)